MLGFCKRYNLAKDGVRGDLFPSYAARKENIMVAKKTTKRVVKKVNETTNIVEEQKPITDEEKILGVSPTVETKKEFNYESPTVQYKVSNLILKNNPVIVSGAVVEAFIGSNNIDARMKLKSGVKSVITYNGNKEEQYKIEVL